MLACTIVSIVLMISKLSSLPTLDYLNLNADGSGIRQKSSSWLGSGLTFPSSVVIRTRLLCRFMRPLPPPSIAHQYCIQNTAGARAQDPCPLLPTSPRPPSTLHSRLPSSCVFAIPEPVPTSLITLFNYSIRATRSLSTRLTTRKTKPSTTTWCSPPVVPQRRILWNVSVLLHTPLSWTLLIQLLQSHLRTDWIFLGGSASMETS